MKFLMAFGLMQGEPVHEISVNCWARRQMNWSLTLTWINATKVGIIVFLTRRLCCVFFFLSRHILFGSILFIYFLFLILKGTRPFKCLTLNLAQSDTGRPQTPHSCRTNILFRDARHRKRLQMAPRLAEVLRTHFFSCTHQRGPLLSLSFFKAALQS